MRTTNWLGQSDKRNGDIPVSYTHLDVYKRQIFRHVDQDFLDGINLQTALNMEKYRQRQMIVEHPFGTIKRNWGAYYFLTKGKLSVTAEAALTFLAYNMKRVMNILGNKEMLRRLREKREAVTV